MGLVRIKRNGLAGDEQADRRRHGGPEKAVHHYPFDHYASWRSELSVDSAVLEDPGAFGENISTLGLTEKDICVGDLWQLGAVLLEVSQARQPCWKLDERFCVSGMARRVQQTGRTGWYYRVREEGEAQVRDMLKLVHRPHPEWPLSRVLHAFYVNCLDTPVLEGLTQLSALSESWRLLAQRRLERSHVEDWEARLTGEEV